jgi:hypothetical protein
VRRYLPRMWSKFPFPVTCYTRKLNGAWSHGKKKGWRAYGVPQGCVKSQSTRCIGSDPGERGHSVVPLIHRGWPDPNSGGLPPAASSPQP